MSKSTFLLYLNPSGVTLLHSGESDEAYQKIGECTWKDFEVSPIQNPLFDQLQKQVHIVLHPELTYSFSVKMAQSANNNPDMLRKVVESKVPEPPKGLVWGYRSKKTETTSDATVTIDIFAPVLRFWDPVYQLLQERQIKPASVHPLGSSQNKVEGQALSQALKEDSFSLMFPNQPQETQVLENKTSSGQQLQKQKFRTSHLMLLLLISTLAISVTALIVWYVFK